MKKLTAAIILGMGMSLPLGVMASPDDELTIRVMEMNESSPDTVMKVIELPDAASDVAREQVRNRGRDRTREHSGEDEKDNHDNDDMDKQEDKDRDHESEMEQEQEQEQEHEMENEIDHEQEMEHEMENEIDHEQEMEHEMDHNEIETMHERPDTEKVENDR